MQKVFDILSIFFIIKEISILGKVTYFFIKLIYTFITNSEWTPFSSAFSKTQSRQTILRYSKNWSTSKIFTRDNSLKCLANIWPNFCLILFTKAWLLNKMERLWLESHIVAFKSNRFMKLPSWQSKMKIKAKDLDPWPWIGLRTTANQNKSLTSLLSQMMER